MKKCFLTIPLIWVVFWNLRNFMDYRVADDRRYGSKSAFYIKCSRISKAVMKIGDDCGSLPDVMAFAEVQDRFVLERLLYSTALCKAGYGIIHYDSPDPRGIDCAMLYRRDSLELLGSRPCHLYDADGSVMRTRDILLAVFRTAAGDTLGVLVNHHPSKLRAGSEERRETAKARMNFLADSLLDAGCCGVIAVGDFNDTVEGEGHSYKYNGHWDRIDGCFIFGKIKVEQKVCGIPELSEPDQNYGGVKPWAEISDHYPVLFHVFPNYLLPLSDFDKGH